MKCDRENVDISKQMYFTLLSLILVGFIIAMYYMVTITKIEYGGVNKLTPDYFETYQHCNNWFTQNA